MNQGLPKEGWMCAWVESGGQCVIFIVSVEKLPVWRANSWASVDQVRICPVIIQQQLLVPSSQDFHLLSCVPS